MSAVANASVLSILILFLASTGGFMAGQHRQDEPAERHPAGAALLLYPYVIARGAADGPHAVPTGYLRAAALGLNIVSATPFLSSISATRRSRHRRLDGPAELPVLVPLYGHAGLWLASGWRRRCRLSRVVSSPDPARARLLPGHHHALLREIIPVRSAHLGYVTIEIGAVGFESASTSPAARRREPVGRPFLPGFRSKRNPCCYSDPDHRRRLAARESRREFRGARLEPPRGRDGRRPFTAASDLDESAGVRAGHLVAGLPARLRCQAACHHARALSSQVSSCCCAWVCGGAGAGGACPRRPSPVF